MKKKEWIRFDFLKFITQMQHCIQRRKGQSSHLQLQIENYFRTADCRLSDNAAVKAPQTKGKLKYSTREQQKNIETSTGFN